MDPAGILRDVSVDGQVHVLARARTFAETAPAALGRDPAAELAYQRGLAEGRALAAELAREETERAVAQRVREEVAAALAQLSDTARREGREAGLAEAQRWLEQERQAAAARVEAVLTSLATRAHEWMRAAEDELVLLAHEAACRVVAEAAVRPEAIRLLVRRLLQERGGDTAEVLRVHVHPDDFTALASDEPGGSWRWVSDMSVALGGVVLRSAGGSVDARLETQLAALAEVLREARARRDGEAA
jgi:flagellar assembly protein FliH